MVGLNAIVAKTDAEAQRHFTSLQQSFTNLRRGRPGQVPRRLTISMRSGLPPKKASAAMTLLVSAVGSPETVERALLKFIDVTQPDEIIVTAHIYDHGARLRSFELLAGVHSRLAPRESSSDLGKTASSKTSRVTA